MEKRKAACLNEEPQPPAIFIRIPNRMGEEPEHNRRTLVTSSPSIPKGRILQWRE